jgi:glycerol-3-phosphate dehydrogenase
MNTIKSQYDVLVIGGGINGVGVAADCAGRGLSVLLCEQGDLASGTSSASSKLIHGGLRYLEQYDFSLVRESLHERAILQKISPHLTHALPFIIPCHKKTRPAWLMRLGLFIYDLLAFPSNFAKSSTITFNQSAYPLKDFLKKGFIYTDCQTDDARLVILNALRAKEKGAKILTRTRCIEAFRRQDYWQVVLEGQAENISIQAKVVVNAGGPWLPQILKNIFKQEPSLSMRLVKGSHFVLPKLYPENKAYLLQHGDKRVVFVIPYHDHYSLIGTTDEDYNGPLEKVKI